MKTELVIAKYKENLDWLKPLRELGIDVTIYDKSKGQGKARSSDDDHGKVLTVPLQNIGREPQSFLTHLVHRYDDLADVTIFLQGNPFEHCQGVKELIGAIVAGKLEVKSELMGTGAPVECVGFIPLADVFAWEDKAGGNCFVPWIENLKKESLPAEEVWNVLFPDAECPEWFHFGGGGQFAITRDHARELLREVYQAALEKASMEDWRLPHAFERMWGSIFS